MPISRVVKVIQMRVVDVVSDSAVADVCNAAAFLRLGL